MGTIWSNTRQQGSYSLTVFFFFSLSVESYFYMFKIEPVDGSNATHTQTHRQLWLVIE